MLITRIRAKNWACHSDLDIKLKPGLNGIIGENGSGKSSALDALRFAITGKSIAEGKSGDNVKLGQKSGYAEVDFTHGDASYVVRRHAETSKVKMTFGDTSLLKAFEIQEHLEKTLQTSFDAMLNNVFVGQHAIDEILYKANIDRLKEFQKTFGLTRMAEAYRMLTVELSACAVTPGLTAQRDLLVAATKDTRKALDDAKAKLNELLAEMEWMMDTAKKVVAHETCVQLRDAKDKSLAEVDRMAKEIKEAEAKVAQLKRKVDEEALQEAKRLENTAACVALLESFRIDSAKLGSLMQESAKLDAVEAPKGDLSGTKAALEAETARRSRLEAILKGDQPLPRVERDDQIVEELRQLSEAVIQRKLNSRVKTLAQTVEREKKILDVFASGVCPTCERPLEKFNPAAQQAKIDAAISALNLAEKEEIDALNAAERMIAALKAEQTKRNVAAMAAVKGAHEACVSKVQQLAKEVKRLEEAQWIYDNAQKRKPELLAEIQRIALPSKDAVATAQSVVNTSKDATTAFNALKTAYASQNAALNALLQQHAKAVEALPSFDLSTILTPEEYANAKQVELDLQQKFAIKREYETQVGVAEGRLQSQNAAIQQLNAQIDAESKTARWADLCSRARDVVHVNGLPLVMLQEYAARINARIAHYLQTWEAPFRVHLDETLAFKAVFDTGFELPAARLSGGQKIVASTSFRLAMSDTFAKNVGLLVLDEPTNHLDKANVTHLQQLLLKLRQFAGTTHRQIIIVTHEEQLLNFFDHTVKLAKIE